MRERTSGTGARRGPGDRGRRSGCLEPCGRRFLRPAQSPLRGPGELRAHFAAATELPLTEMRARNIVVHDTADPEVVCRAEHRSGATR
jgi:hypothetical protein